MPTSIYAPPPCEKCDAKCCTNKAPWNTITLTPAEEKVMAAVGAKVTDITFESGEIVRGFMFDETKKGCQFLKGSRCTVYDIRPAVCRTFTCRNKTFEGVPEFIASNKDLAEILNTRA